MEMLDLGLSKALIGALPTSGDSLSDVIILAVRQNAVGKQFEGKTYALD